MGVGPFGFALLLGVLFSRPQVEPNWSAPATRIIDESGPHFETRHVGNSPIGNWSVQSSAQSVSVFNPVAKKGWKWTVAKGDMLGTTMFAPDESWLMSIGAYSNTLSSGGRVWFFDLKTGKIINVWSGKATDDDGAAFSTFFSPRGRYVGIKRFSNVLRVWEVRTHRDFAFRWSAGAQDFDLFSWTITEFSPDETHILLGGKSRNLRLVDLRAQTIRQAQLPLTAAKTSAASARVSVSAHFSADGQFVNWADSSSDQKGRLSLDDFNQKVTVEIIDGATSRPR